MNSTSKSSTLFFILIMAISSLSLIMVKPATAQTIPKPSIPEFTLKYADHSYDVPSTTTSTFNPYNNQTTITTTPGYHVQKQTIDMTTKNQPIPPTIDGNKSYLLYWIRQKGHYDNSTDWIYPYQDAIDAYPRQSNSDYTVISLPTSYTTTTHYGENTKYLQAGDEIDFQVRAILAYGYNHSISAVYPVYSYDYESVATSDWSNTQTLTITALSNPTPTPTVPEFPLLVILPFFVSLLLVAVYLKHRRTNHE
jgi:hypothetical protein